MKRIMMLLFIALLVLTAAGCGNSPGENAYGKADGTTATSASEISSEVSDTATSISESSTEVSETEFTEIWGQSDITSETAASNKNTPEAIKKQPEPSKNQTPESTAESSAAAAASEWLTRWKSECTFFDCNYIPDAEQVLAIKAQDTSGLSGVDKQVADKAIAVLREIIKPGMREVDKVRAVHEYLCTRVFYDEKSALKTWGDITDYITPDYCYHPEGVLLYGTGVCSGFARTKTILLESLGIRCLAYPAAGHTVNYIRIEGQWYFSDSTNDNGSLVQYTTGEVRAENFAQYNNGDVRYDNFLLGGGDIPERFRRKESVSSYDRVKIFLYEGAVKVSTYTFSRKNSDNYVVNLSGRHIVIPDSVKEICKNAFYGTSLTSIQIGNGVKVIGAQAFGNNRQLTTVTIPSGVEKIDDWAFQACTELRAITIPESVTEIGDDVFLGCNNLKIICKPGSRAETYAKQRNIPMEYY